MHPPQRLKEKVSAAYAMCIIAIGFEILDADHDTFVELIVDAKHREFLLTSEI